MRSQPPMTSVSAASSSATAPSSVSSSTSRYHRAAGYAATACVSPNSDRFCAAAYDGSPLSAPRTATVPSVALAASATSSTVAPAARASGTHPPPSTSARKYAKCRRR